ncbi:MAG: VWA domain-containing protein [Pyrinomonadaceae bacterium]
MNDLMRFLFKHERAVFTKGQFAFDTRLSYVLLALAVALALLLIYYLYLQPRFKLSSKTLATLVALRLTFFAFLLFLLLRPVLIVSSVVPRSSDVAVLVDDSQSMQLADESDARTRLDAVKAKLFTGENSPWQILNRKFKTDLLGFSRNAIELSGVESLAGDGTTTDVAGALRNLMRRSVNRPLSAVVLVTDGAHNGKPDLEEQLRQLRAKNVPVFTVGVGRTSLPKDAELMRVNMPRRALIGSAIHAEALVRTSGYQTGSLLLSVREDGRTIKTRELTLRGDTEVQTINLDFSPAGAGLRRYTFSLTPLEDELTLVNNTQEALLEVGEGPIKVLYIEGEPRWEYGKLRTALTRNEKNVILVSFLRSGENKFYRQGVESEGDLASGFPVTQDELFSYQGLILGSVEASFFTTEQLKNIEAFVARRGGGLLALGGRRAFEEGRFASTPVADLLPLSLTGGSGKSADAEAPIYKAQLTARGRSHPILRFQEDDAANQKNWDELSPLTIPQVLQAVKPGATVLLEARRTIDGKASGAAIPLLVEERYGRGQSLAFTASDTWRWQMRMDSKRNLHETFWRQMLRYLASPAPKQIEIEAAQVVSSLGDTVRLVADVRNSKFEPLKDAHVKARVSAPSGATQDVSLAFTSRDGLDIYEEVCSRRSGPASS